VRFKNQGLDSIEVQDNGDGISSNNYETIALKHYTSKLSTYSDLTTLQTFGFRGEALSSLCALSRFSIITCVAADAPKGTRLDFEVSGKLKGTGVVAAQKGTTVVVENLFNNLPVRRRELERNIKREWGKVVGVLGQYACIQTGIKFSVTQQATKGKKTSLFSTKGNQTTRENIINVFGAKTLTALVPLDLNLELEATSGSGQKWSTQEDGIDKNIHIVGHISRPASGEGRQTPDRQMFFVNARPCGLPQVAKAFNEVYKSYNGSQSPFIFANIELDTHLYDVNVSPDKRTILLHDQSRMLENMKVALIELFESQDYTVPIAQLSTLKQPSYRQLSINQERSITPKASQISTESNPEEDSPLGSRSRMEEVEERKSRTSSNMVDSDDERSPKKKDSVGVRRSQRSSQDNPHSPPEPVKPNAVNREFSDLDIGANNLPSSWLGRKTESRIDSDGQAAYEADNGVSGTIFNDKVTLIEKLQAEARQPDILASPEDPDSSVVHCHTTKLLAPSLSPSPRTENHSTERVPGGEELETPIPVLLSPAKSSSVVLNTFSGAKLQRASPEVATITIGDDHTVISPVGTPHPKKQRTDYEASSRYTEGDILSDVLPSFGSRLSQRFAAPGSQQTISGDGEVKDLDIEEDFDSLQQPEEISGTDGDDSDEDIVPETLLTTTMEEGVYSSVLVPDMDGDADGEYIDEETKKLREEAKVQQMIKAAEIAAIQPSEENTLRAKALLKGGGRKKDSTFNLQKTVDICSLHILHQLHIREEALKAYSNLASALPDDDALETKSAEEKLSLTISKDDFAKMKVIGQFNLGFILASRAAKSDKNEVVTTGDELFIIDQHASDEKYNFERLQSTTLVQSQRLVQAKTLDLTAIEEEIVMENLAAIEANGFVIKVDQSGDMPIGQRCQLVSLPISRETTFSIADLEELLALLVENPTGSIPRPSKVRKMFAMRACRSSIMIGRTLTLNQMGKVRN